MLKKFIQYLLLPCTLLFPFHAKGSLPYIADAEKQSLTVVTYNIDTDQRQSNEQQTAKFLQSNAPGLKELMSTSPDVVNLQEVPLGGIQWLEKNYGNDYKIVYAAKRGWNSENKKNDYTAILYKKSRFQELNNSRYNPSIKTKYFNDKTGHFFLLVEVKDLETNKHVAFVNSHIKGGMFRYMGNKEAQEIIDLLQKYSLAIVAGDFNGMVNNTRLVAFAEYGYIHDPVTEPTEPSKNRKFDHILFKGSGKSKFITDQCRVNTNIKGSDHYPLTCRVFLY